MVKICQNHVTLMMSLCESCIKMQSALAKLFIWWKCSGSSQMRFKCQTQGVYIIHENWCSLKGTDALLSMHKRRITIRTNFLYGPKAEKKCPQPCLLKTRAKTSAHVFALQKPKHFLARRVFPAILLLKSGRIIIWMIKERDACADPQQRMQRPWVSPAGIHIQMAKNFHLYYVRFLLCAYPHTKSRCHHAECCKSLSIMKNAPEVCCMRSVNNFDHWGIKK